MVGCAVAACACIAALAACTASSGAARRAGDATRPTGADGSVSQIVLAVRPLAGGAPTDAELAESVSIIDRRVHDAGLDDVHVVRRGRRIIVTTPRQTLGRVEALAGRTGLLRFRQVLAVGAYGPPGRRAAPTAPRTNTTVEAAVPLPGSESGNLATMESSFAGWDCGDNPNPTAGADSPDDYVIACDDPAVSSGGVYRYLLAPAAVEGAQVERASAGRVTNGVGWQVNLAFDGSGSAAWLALTKKAYEVTNSGDTGFAGCGPPKGCNAVAIVVDGVVESAPAIQSDGIPGGLAQIAGDFDEATATNLADILTYGALPARLAVVDVSTVGG